ncbi:MAG: PHB depolymerase family esterase [Pseudomonadota bacterium]
MNRSANALAALAIALAAAVATALASGCGANQAGTDPAQPVTLEQRKLTVGERVRRYRFFDGGAAAQTLVPLVIVFHGGQGDGAKIARQTGLHDLAAREGFAVAFPDSIDYWQDGRATTGTGEWDVRFVRALITTLAERDNVDPKRVYATGASNGGMFTLRLACEANDVIAAFAPVIASFPEPYADRCEPGRAVPVLMVNGTADRLIQWRGGSIFKGARRGAGGEVIPVPDTAAFWQQNNGCDAVAKTEPLPDIDPDDGTRVTRLRYAGCAAGSEFELVRIDGGGHAWPSRTRTAPPAARRLVGNVSADYDASSEVWAFFQRHSL